MRRPMLLAATLLAASAAQAAVVFTAPTPYLRASDSPYVGPYLYSHLEDLEDGLLNATGLGADAGSVLNPGQQTDSVDADDGAVDGLGTRGHSWYVASTALTLSYSAVALGQLPTRVGVVFTDIGLRTDTLPPGFGVALIEVFDGNGVSLGSSSFEFGDGSTFGGTAEDRFIGAESAAGIGSIRIGFSGASVDWEADHFFYGRTAGVSAPPSLALALVAGVLLASTRRGRQR